MSDIGKIGDSGSTFKGGFHLPPLGPKKTKNTEKKFSSIKNAFPSLNPSNRPGKGMDQKPKPGYRTLNQMKPEILKKVEFKNKKSLTNAKIVKPLPNGNTTVSKKPLPGLPQHEPLPSNEVQFQRDLSSFSVKKGKFLGSKEEKFLTDKMAIAIDVKAGLTMLVSAAEVSDTKKIGPSTFERMINGDSEGITVQKMQAFFVALEEFIEKHNPLYDKVFEKIELLVESRFGPKASIGALDEGTIIPIMPDLLNEEKFKKKFEQDYPHTIGTMHQKNLVYQEKLNMAKQENALKRGEALKEQIAALKKAVPKSFNSNVPAMQRDFRAIQFIAAGVDLLEQLQELQGKKKDPKEALLTCLDNPEKPFNKDLQSQSKALFEALNGEGNPLSNTHNLGTMKTLRSGVFFMEFALEPIDNAICDRIGQYLRGKGEPDANVNNILAAMKKKLETSRAHSTGNPEFATSGFRGRNIFHKGNNAIYGDRATPIESPMASRCSDIDLPALEQAKTINTTTKAFIEKMQKGKAFSQKKRTAGQTANFQTLPQSRVDILNDPLKFLKETAQEANVTLSVTLDQNENENENENALKKQFLYIKFTDKQGKSRRLGHILNFVGLGKQPKLSSIVRKSGWKVESKPSLGSIMKDTGLRTLCSVSGTTTDIVVGLVAHMGKEPVTSMLKSLEYYVKKGCPHPPGEPQLSTEFKELFLAIAMYMQSGQYHSEGEVLAGLYFSALTFTNDPDVNDFDKILPKFQKMWEALRDYPENFYPLSEKSKKELNQKSPQIIQALQDQHKKTIAGRHDQAMKEFKERRSKIQLTQKEKALEEALLKTPEEQEAEEQQLRKNFRRNHEEAFEKIDKPKAQETPVVSPKKKVQEE
jgi:hypothetical protein